MLASDDIHLGLCFSANSLWSTRYFKVLPNVGRVKSSVDDLTMERGTVSMRVALVLRSAEVQPLFRDLCIRFAMPILPPPPCSVASPFVPLLEVRAPPFIWSCLIAPFDL